MIKRLKRPISFLSAFAMVMAMLLYFPSGMFSNIDWGLKASAEGEESVTFETVAGEPGGIATNEGYESLLDGSTGTKWCCSFSRSAYVVIKASEPIYVSGYTISTGNDTASNSGRNPKTWTLSACNDYDKTNKTSENWTQIHEVTGKNSKDTLPAENYASKPFEFTETTETYQYFKLEITSIVGGNIMQISEFALKYSTCNHNWVKTETTIPPTCTVGGYDVYECSVCHGTKNVANDVPATEHKWISSDVVAPTCTKKGYTPQTCSVCNAEQKIDITDVVNHNYVQGICSVCRKGESESRPIQDENDVYQIGTAGELYWFADKVNSGDTRINAVLTKDITVNSNVLNESGNPNGTSFTSWTPIGNYSNQYTGTFDGQNHTISGLYFNDTNIGWVGLFEYIYGGKISNVGVVDSYFNGKEKVGGVCGYNEIGTITNCYNTGTVSGSYCWVGGVCGYNKGTIENCYNKGTVNGSGAVGGVCGANENSITNCYNTGAVTGAVSGLGAVGGVCGENYVSGETAKITNCYNTGAVSGSDAVGGVCGKNVANEETAEITNCYNTGAVSGSDAVGGVCGYNTARGGGIVEITNCYNTGEVTGTGYSVGGVSGYNEGSEGGAKSTITNCYNSGKVNGNYVSGVIGLNCSSAPIEVTNSYYLSKTATDDGGKTEEQFKNGSVCYLLNGGISTTPVWYQTLETELYPNLDSTNSENRTVYASDPCPSEFSNTNNLERVEHIFEEVDDGTHKCKNCGLVTVHSTEPLTYTADEDTDKITVKCGDNCGKEYGTVTLSAPTENLTYDGTEKTATVSNMVSGIENFTNPDITYSKTGDETFSGTPKDAGTYTASITLGTGDGAAMVSVEFTIARKPITITADDKSKTYGGTDPALSFTVSEKTPLVDDEELKGTLSREAGADAGTYKITQGTVTNDTNPNYDITFSEGTFTINKAQTDKTAACVMNLVYDESYESYTATITKEDGAEYKFGESGEWSAENTLTEIAPHTSVTGYIRIAGDENHNPSTTNSLTLKSGHGTLTYVERKEPDCENAGNKEYWYCESCKKCFSDEDGETEISKEDVTIPATNHNWNQENYELDATHHWHNCQNENCPITDNSQKDGYGEHVDSDNNGICDNCNKLIHSIVREVSATLDGDIGLNYYIALPESVTADTGAYVQFTVNGQNTKVYVKDVTDIDGSVYKFTCWLTAKEMRDNVTFKLYDGKGTLIDIYSNSGDKVEGASFDYTLETYLKTLSSDENAALKYLADATLVYGAYAQNAFNHNADPNLDGSDLEDVTLGTLETNKMIKTGDIPEGLKLTEMTLILETETTLRLYFKSDNIENYTFKLDSTGVTLNKIEEEGLYYVEIANISAKDLDTKYTLIINDNCELTFNALSYAYATVKAGTNENICNVVKALYKYNDAANAYFGE